MKKELRLTDRILNKFINSLKEQEKSKSTISTYKRELFALQMYMDDEKVTKDKLIKYKELLTERYVPTTCNVSIAAINAFLKYANRYDLLLKPMRVQQNTFAESGEKLSRRDYEKLLHASEISGKERLSLIIQTLCATGIRVSELKDITVECLKTGQAIVTNKGKSRKIFLPRQLVTLLKTYVVKHNITKGSIFVTKNGNPIDRSNIWKEMKHLCGIAGVKSDKVFPHNFRHLFASTYYKKEKNLSFLSDILGHSSVNTTKIYTRETGAVHARQVERLGFVRTTTENTT